MVPADVAAPIGPVARSALTDVAHLLVYLSGRACVLLGAPRQEMLAHLCHGIGVEHVVAL